MVPVERDKLKSPPPHGSGMPQATSSRLHACPSCGGRSDLAGECRACRKARLQREALKARPRPPLVIGIAAAQILLGLVAATVFTAVLLDGTRFCLTCGNTAGVQAFVLYMMALPLPAIALGAGMLWPSRAAWLLSVFLQIGSVAYALVTDTLLVGDIVTLATFLGVPVAFLVCLVLPTVRTYYAKPDVSEDDVMRDEQRAAA